MAECHVSGVNVSEKEKSLTWSVEASLHMTITAIKIIVNSLNEFLNVTLRIMKRQSCRVCARLARDHFIKFFFFSHPRG